MNFCSNSVFLLILAIYNKLWNIYLNMEYNADVKNESNYYKMFIPSLMHQIFLRTCTVLGPREWWLEQSHCLMGLEICKERWMLQKIHNYLVTNSDECYEGKLQCNEREWNRGICLRFRDQKVWVPDIKTTFRGRVGITHSWASVGKSGKR